MTFATQDSLNWAVAPAALTATLDNGSQVEVPGKVAQVRSDNGRVLGITSPTYEVYQNNNLKALVEPLIQEGVLKIVTQGYLGKGEKVFIQAEMTQGYRIVGEEHKGMMTLLNSHDGSSTLAAGVTDQRVICSNTFAMALKSMSHKIRHNGDIYSKALEITETIQFVNEGMEKFGEAAEILATTKCNEETLDSLLSYAFKKDDVTTLRPRNQIVEFYRNGVGTEGKTLWDGLNGLTQWVTHNSSKKEGTRFASTNFGKGSEVTRRFMNSALSLA